MKSVSYFFSKTFMLFVMIACAQQLIAQGDGQNFYGDSYKQKKERQQREAIDAYTKVIKQKPLFDQSYQGRGNIYMDLGILDSAMADYSKCVALSPRNAVHYYNRGNLFNRLQQYDSALADLDKALELKPNYSLALALRGGMLGRTKHYNEAMADLNRCLMMDTGQFWAYNNRGLVYLMTGHYAKAVEDFKTGIRQDTNYERPFLTLNILEPLIRLNRFDETAAYYKFFRQHYSTGYIDYQANGGFRKYVLAVTDYLVDSNYQAALDNLNEGEKMYSAKGAIDANDDFTRRTFSSTLALKGYVYEQMKNDELAKQAYEQASLLNENQPEVVAALARISKRAESLVQADDTPPVISIIEPTDAGRSISVEDDKVAGTKQHIRGRAIDASVIKSIRINNAALKVEENGYFDTVVNITEGPNIFTIVATDQHANSSSINVQLNAARNIASSVVQKDGNAVPGYNPIYHAVLIAEKDYEDKNIRDLPGTLTDMNTMYSILVNNYGFAPDNVDTLVSASKTTILETLLQRSNSMTDNDNLFIFYAGHGDTLSHENDEKEGFLIPQNAERGKISTYISTDDLVRTIKYSKAKHILFVADACFAGALFRDMASEAPAPVAEAYKDKSRKLLASGNLTKVSDKSDFIEDLKLAMLNNRESYITAEQLIDSFKVQYSKDTHLSVQYYPIRNVNDLGGQFVFKRKTVDAAH